MFYKVIWFYTKHEKGASMVEYALLVMMIAMVALAAVAIAGSELSETYSEISSGLIEAGN